MRQISFLGLVVIYAAVVTGSKPSFLVNFENITAKEGSHVDIECSALGDRPITYEWYNQYDDRITGDMNASIYVSNSENGSTLVIPKVRRSDEGTYTCTASNQLGLSSKLYMLTLLPSGIIGRPGALTEIIFHKVTPTTITFLFVGPNDTGGMPIARYHVKYQLAEQEDALVKGITWHIDDTPYILRNLIPRAKYQFSAAALNAVAMGEEIDAIYVMPEETEPEPPVIRTRNETVSEYPDRFEIRWDAPNDNGKPILRYGIRYFRVRRAIRAWTQIENGFESSVDADDLSFEMERLMPDSYYKIEIRARNEIGNSMPASVVIKTGKGETNNTHIIVTNLRLPIIIAAAQVAVFVILVIVDVTSFFKCHCGLLYLARYRRCGRSVENV